MVTLQATGPAVAQVDQEAVCSLQSPGREVAGRTRKVILQGCSEEDRKETGVRR